VDAFGQGLRELAKISPIDHFAAFEEILFRGGDPGELLQGIQNEFPDETLLELALSYKKLGRPENSLSLLSLATDTKTQLHRAFMLRDSQPGTSAGILERMAERSPEFVFPYRRETLEVLEWAVAQNPHWKFNYFLAQNYLAVGLEQEGKKALQACGGSPDQDTFYRFRAKLSTDAPYPVRLEDLQRALDLGRENWKNWEELLLFQLQHQKHREAAELGNRALERFPGNYSIGLGQAKALLAVGQYARAIALLDTLVILPFEHASESKRIYTQAHIYLARELMAKGRYGRAIPLLEASKAWPENLGVGAPYDPDDRLADYLLALCHIGNRDPQRADAHIAAVADHPLGGHEIGTNALFSALALKRLGREEPLKALLDQIRAKAATSPEAALVWNLYHGKRDRAKEIMAQLGTDARCRELLTTL